MTLDILKSADVIQTLEAYLEKIRPEPEIRNEIDFSYEIEEQSVILYELHPFWNDREKTISTPYAKATYVISKDHWKVYWMRGNLKWYPYDPMPTAKSLKAFLNLVDEDKYACFKG